MWHAPRAVTTASVHPPLRPPAAATGRDPDAELALDVLTIVLALALWFAASSYALAWVDGLGDHPVRRAVIGGVLVGICTTALVLRRPVAVRLRRAPVLILPVACGFQLASSADAPGGGPYTALTLALVFVAAVVARPRTVWLTVLALAITHAAGAVLAGDVLGLGGRDVGGILGHLVALPFAAGIFLGFVLLMRQTTDRAPAAIGDARERAARALAPEALDAGPNPTETLTPAERRVLAGLVAGRAVKEIARDLGIAPSTAQTHVRNMKRKTGARTIAELVGLGIAYAAVPAEDDRGD